jgi:hypothetical protein
MPSLGGWDAIAVHFVVAKTTAIEIMLRDFSAVIRSDAYSRQISSDSDEDGIAAADIPFVTGSQVGNDEDAVLLLHTCLEELAHSPLRKMPYVGIREKISNKDSEVGSMVRL